MAADKLNSMRLLEQAGVAYTVHTYPEVKLDAAELAAYLGLPPERVYKTLVTLGEAERPALAMIPAGRSLDLKALARALGQKRCRMASQAEAEALTGLKVGGIGALALRHKPWPCLLDESAQRLPGGRLLVSAGRRGINLELEAADLARVLGARQAPLCQPAPA